jgi:hypothetical protein
MLLTLNGLRHIAQRLGLSHARSVPEDEPPPSSWPAELDTAWYGHGDHWHNLLASPLDARHYVMEDWAEPPAYAPPRAG